ncbi:hypothetical protein BJ944DRAFT_280521 [Cunninghamella echinulata]|nr:hypothetical protein BJ944DRAFT_280521 [Cunninghamella echinulata]
MVQTLYSIKVSEAKEGETEIRRSILAADELLKSPSPEVQNLFDILEYSATHYPDRNGFGYRKLEKTFHDEKEIKTIVNDKEVVQKKTWTYFQLSGYHYYTYAEALDTVKLIGFGLKHLGLSKGDRVHIFASTSYEWMFVAQGAFSQSMTISTAYDTLGKEGLQHSINETESRVCFINGDHLNTLEDILPQCPDVKYIIYRGDAKEVDIQRLKQKDQIQQVISFQELIGLGKEHPSSVVKPAYDDLACIMYTSGSCGAPKGVLLTHGNVVSSVGGCSKMLKHLVIPGDTMMAYLPLAHILEFLVQSLCIFLGLTLGYGSIRTLTDVSVRNCKGDIQEFAPSIMTGVPQVWETIRKTILSKVVERGPRIESIFHGAVDLKEYLGDRGLPNGFLDKIVFKNVKQQLGGRMRYGLSGGAPLSIETQRFLSLTLCPIVTGYGFQVGAPMPSVEVKLVDVPEAGYYSTNEPKPQGEVWIRGHSITSGYFKQDDITKESLTSDGWLKTGDIGEWNENGTLSIIDRKKNLIKLSNGEYIALEKLESKYKSSVLVENLCVYADPLCNKPVALMNPVESQLRSLAESEKWSTDNWEELCKAPETRKKVLTILQEQGKKSGLKGNEIIADVWICSELWLDSGLLTAAQKLKRHSIKQRYQHEIQTMIDAIKS